jgi:YVTN family beta-propeller protein
MISLFPLLICGCVAPQSLVKPALEHEGEVYVYLQPLPQEAERLTFTIGHLAAVGSDGRDHPLSLSVREFHGNAVRRQRLIAAGTLPPGQYTGLSVTAAKATLKGEEGEADLLLPDTPVRTNFPFTIERRKAVVLSLAFQYAESVQTGFSFTPAFSVFIPSRPAAGLVGYVNNRDDNTVTVFDKKTGQAAEIIATGNGPESIAFDRRAGRAYVSLSGDDAIEVIESRETGPRIRMNLNGGDGPQGLGLTPDGSVLLSVNAASRTLSIINPFTLIELGRIPVGDGARSLLVDRSGRRCYVFNVLSNTLSVVDIPGRATVASISTEARPVWGQFNRKNDRLYVIHEGSPYLSVIDPVSLSVVNRVFVGPGLSSMTVDTATDMIYLFRKGALSVEVYDPVSLLLGVIVPGDYITVLSDVVYMTIDNEEKNLYLVSAEKNLLTAVNLISKKIVWEMDAGANPSWVTMMGER